MKKVNFKIFIHTFIVLAWAGSFAPSFGQKYEIGGGLGGAAYSGDIIRRIDPGQAGLQATLFGKWNFDNVWTLRSGFSSAVLQGNDGIKPIDPVFAARNARFRGGVIEFSAVMEFNFLDYLRHDPEFDFSPYAFFGLGYSYFIMSGRNGPEPMEQYQLSSAVIPFGGGVKYRLDDRWTLAAEIGFRPTLTDYLDKIDSKITEKQPGKSGSYKIDFGNPYTKDWYYFVGLTLSYTIYNSDCYAY